MNGQSLNITEDKKKQLKQLFPEVFTEDKIDFDKLRLVLGEDFFAKEERYEFNWAGKGDAFKELQKQTTATLIPDRVSSVNFDTSENIFIEGENLEVLKVLQRSYYGKIKMIYIDPPYNTGNDSFVYPDDYKERKKDYEQRTGIKNKYGFVNKQDLWKKNAKEGGHFHSVWLSMMYPRLYLARNLLKEDGVILVSIDDNEQANLRKLLDRILGEANFIASVIWEKKFAPSNDSKWFSANHDYILIYAKDKNIWRPNLLKRESKTLDRYKNPDNDIRGVWTSGDMTVKTYNKDYDYEVVTPSGNKITPPNGKCWRFSKQKFQELVKDNRIWFGKNQNNVPRIKRFLTEVKQGVTPLTIWKNKDVGHTQEASQEIRKIFQGKQIFDNPKPVRLVTQLISICSNKDDLVLDFFAGSGTLAEAILRSNVKKKLSRKFICVQIPEKTPQESEARKFGYKKISEIAQARIINVLGQIRKEDETNLNLGFKSFKLTPSNFKQWDNNIEKGNVVEQLNIFQNPYEDNAKHENMVYEILLKKGLTLTTKIEKRSIIYGGKTVNFYNIEQGQFIIALEAINQVIIDEVMRIKPVQLITLDRLFKGNDQFLTNVKLQLEESKIGLQII